jgi:uncharacterized protein DUF4157
MFVPPSAQAKAEHQASQRDGKDLATRRFPFQRGKTLHVDRVDADDGQEASPRSLTARGETRGVSWDFSKIPITSADTRDSSPALTPPDVMPTVSRGHDMINAPPIVGSAVREAGHPIDSVTLTQFQIALNHDLSAVRLHTGDRAAASAASLGARAYTVGHHVVFGRGEYAPTTAGGRHLIGHELAHVIQQSRGGSSTPAEDPSLQASADHAADRVASGHLAPVAGSSKLGIARQLLFDQFSAGKYNWPLLKLAITEGARPVDTIVADINALSSAERDQAIKDITQERTNQARKLADLTAKQSAQADPALQTVFDPMIQHVADVTSKADQVLDGLFTAVAAAETAASLRAGTVPPSAAQKPLIESALKPDLRTTAAGAVIPFEENLPGDPKSYLDKLRDITPKLIEAHHKQQVDNRGKAEHDDPTKVHPLSEFERIGKASKRETDKVFGQFKKGPALKADTKTSRGNIHDLWQDTENQLKGMSPAQKRDMARQLIFYFFQSDSEIADINRAHNADPKLTAPLNQEAKDQQLVATEITAKPDEIKQLNEIDRGWDASAGGGSVNIQIFRKADKISGPLAGLNVADRDLMWDMFQTLVHEYLHTLAHPAYNTFASSFGEGSNQENTLVEGADSLLDEIVWSAVAPHINDPALRNDVEGPVYSALPPMNVAPASRRRYDSYTQAVKLVNIIGIRNLYAAYFLGDVKKIKGVI